MIDQIWTRQSTPDHIAYTRASTGARRLLVPITQARSLHPGPQPKRKVLTESYPETVSVLHRTTLRDDAAKHKFSHLVNYGYAVHATKAQI